MRLDLHVQLSGDVVPVVLNTLLRMSSSLQFVQALVPTSVLYLPLGHVEHTLGVASYMPRSHVQMKSPGFSGSETLMLSWI